jgi:hypothetical protein
MRGAAVTVFFSRCNVFRRASGLGARRLGDTVREERFGYVIGPEV